MSALAARNLSDLCAQARSLQTVELQLPTQTPQIRPTLQGEEPCAGGLPEVADGRLLREAAPQEGHPARDLGGAARRPQAVRNCSANS